MGNNANNEIDIDILELIIEILHHWKFIAVIFTLMAALFVAITVEFIPKQYEARFSMYVNNGGISNDSYIDSSDINASRSLVSTYMELIKSDCILDEVINRLSGIDYHIDPELITLKNLRKIIKCHQLSDTEIFEVKVRTPSPYLSADIAKIIAEITPNEIARVFKSGSVEIIDNVKLPQKHVSPSAVKNGILGGLVGIIISCVIVVWVSIFDRKVKNSNDYENKYNVPLLGVIPDRMTK